MDIAVQFGQEPGIKQKLQLPIIEQMLNALNQTGDNECLEIAKLTFDNI